MVASLQASDQVNVFEIPLSDDFNGGLAGSQVIFTDTDVSVSDNYDGYTFLQETSFADKSVNVYSVGLFTQIPRTLDYSGWVCQIDPTVSSTTCSPQFVQNLTTTPVPTDFTSEEPEGSWVCTVSRNDQTLVNTVVCKNSMPVEQGSYANAIFRWAPEWGVVEQWGYEQANGQNQWIKLGRVALL